MQAKYATKTDLKSSFQDTDYFMEFPVGLIIIDKGNTQSNYRIAYANLLARNLLSIPMTNDIESFNNTLKRFRKLKSLNNFNSNLQEISLYEQIFTNSPVNEIINEKFVSLELMIYVKIRYLYNSILISVDNYDDERKSIQKNIMKSLNCKYLLTLYHEINNPLSSLINSVEDVFVEEKPKKKEKLFDRIKLLVSLIKIFIKNFVLTFRLEFEDTSKFISNGTFVNLEFIFTKVSTKFSKIFQNKKIICDTNFTVLSDKIKVTEYFYFKNLLKNIFIYSYHRLERESKLGIDIIFTKNNEAKFCFVPKGHLAFQQCVGGYTSSPSSDLDRSFLEEFDVKKSIQTLEMVKDTIMKLATLLGVKVKILDDVVLPYFLMLHLKYQIEIREEDSMNEFSVQTERQREEKLSQVCLSPASPNLIHKSNCGKICSCLENGGKQTAVDRINVATISNSERDTNFEKIIQVSPPCKYSKEQEKLHLLNEKTAKGFLHSDNELTLGKGHLNQTNIYKNGMTPFTQEKIQFERNCRHRNTLIKYIPKMEDINSPKGETQIPKVQILPIESSSSDSSKNASIVKEANKPAIQGTFSTITFKEISREIPKESIPVSKKKKNSAELSKVEEEEKELKRTLEKIRINEESFGDILLGPNAIKSNSKFEEIPHSQAFQDFTISNDLHQASISPLIASRLFSISPSEIPHSDSTLNYTEELVDINNKIFVNISLQKNCTPCLNSNNSPANRRFSNKVESIIKSPIRRINTVKDDKIPLRRCACKDVLLVDDEEFNLTSMKNLMKKHNISVDVALNGKLCLEKIMEKKKYKCDCNRNYYKLIMMDFMMPEMDGLDASMEINKMIEAGELNKEVKIVIVSAHEGEQMMEMIKNNPIIREYIKKPVKKTKLEEILKKFYI